MSEIEELRAEVGRLRDGADPAPRAENAYPTAGQLWHELLHVDTQKRLDRLDYLIGEASTAAYMRVRGDAARAESSEAALASEREAHAGLRARLEALLPTEEYEDAGVLVQPSKIRAALAPVAAEEGGER